MFYLGFKASTFCPVASFPINRQTGGSEVLYAEKYGLKNITNMFLKMQEAFESNKISCNGLQFRGINKHT